MGIRHLKRDPFARSTKVSRRIYGPAKGCAWCGYTPKTPKGRPYLYVYGVEYDDKSRPSWESKQFCGASCHRSYW